MPADSQRRVLTSEGPASRLPGVDVLVILGLVGLVLAAINVQHQWTAQLRPKVDIDLSVTSLPIYTLYSLTRGMVAYAISLIFTLVYGYWAAKHRMSSRVLIPMLDILQSIPVLGFMPGLVIGLISVFPGSNLGLELSAILMIFTGQAWNMTFSFYQSLTSLPKDQVEAADAFRFGWWQRLRRVELPFSTTGLVWNSMMSMAGGWFFLMISESFTLGDRDFRLPGIGSYMSVALDQGNWGAMVAGILAMISMIVLLDQLLWRPLVVWAEKFRVEETASEVAQTSWFLDLLRQSTILAAMGRWLKARRLARQQAMAQPTAQVVLETPVQGGFGHWIAWGATTLLIGSLVWGAWLLVGMLAYVPWSDPSNTPQVTSWLEIGRGTGLTALRVLGTVVIGTLWALPVGLAIGGSPRLSRIMQPIVQVAASFPAPMLFPLCLLVFNAIGLPLGFGSMLLMLMGTQWYILFNVIAGSQSIPSDLRESTTTFRLSRWQRFWKLEAPGVFPALVTGWVTAAGGAWNASIVAEYLTWRGKIYATDGLGSTISRATEHGDYHGLAASVVVMAIVVVAINNVLWRRLQRLAQGRFSMSK